MPLLPPEFAVAMEKACRYGTCDLWCRVVGGEPAIYLNSPGSGPDMTGTRGSGSTPPACHADAEEGQVSGDEAVRQGGRRLVVQVDVREMNRCANNWM